MTPGSDRFEMIKTGRMGKLFDLPPEYWDDQRIGYSRFQALIEGNPVMQPTLPARLRSKDASEDLRALIYPVWAWTYFSSANLDDKVAVRNAELIAMSAMEIGIRFIAPNLPAGVGSKSKQSKGDFQNINVLGDITIIHDKIIKLIRELHDAGAEGSLPTPFIPSLRISSDALTHAYLAFKDNHEGSMSLFEFQYISVVRSLGDELGYSALRTLWEELNALGYKTIVTWEQFLDRSRHAHKSATAKTERSDLHVGLWSQLQLPKRGRPKRVSGKRSWSAS